MEDSTNKVNATQDINNVDAKYINELKANSVNKDEYDKLKKRYEDVVKASIERRPVETDSDNDKDIDYEKVQESSHKALFGKPKTMSNLDFWKTVLAYRKSVLANTGRDVFIQQTDSTKRYDRQLGKDVIVNDSHIPTIDEQETANRVGTQMQAIVDESKNDSSEFDRLYSRYVRGIKC